MMNIFCDMISRFEPSQIQRIGGNKVQFLIVITIVEALLKHCMQMNFVTDVGKDYPHLDVRTLV